MPSAAWAWVPAIGLDLTLMVDPLGWMFALLILGIGLLVVIFAYFYLYPGEATGRFFASLINSSCITSCASGTDPSIPST